MNTFILFMWLSNQVVSGRVHVPIITTQEFNSRKACVDAARVLHIEFGDDFHFMCLEKGKVK